jgi:hypothetical protein
MHKTSNRKVRHQQPIALLKDKLRRLAAQHNPRSPQVRFELVKGSLAGEGLARYKLPVSSPSPSEPLVRFSLKRLTR